MRGTYKKSLSEFILLTLEKAIDGYVKFEDFANNTGFYALGYERNLKKSDLAQALKRLRERGLVEEDKTDLAQVIFKLTNSGRDTLGIEFENEKWDGKYRIVSFDIPEQKRVVRNLFRRNLKKWGFKYLHKSVWVSKRDVYHKMTEYIRQLQLEPWVTVIEADKVSGL